MSNKHLIIILALLLTSCGFEPIYSNQYNSKLITIKIGHIKASKVNRESIELENAIKREFNPGHIEVGKNAILDIDYNISTSSSAIQQNTIATGKVITISLNYSLKSLISNEEITRGKITQVESYEVSNSPFSDYVLTDELNIKIVKSLAYRLRNSML